MGHNIRVLGSYYKPTEKEVLEDYLKASGLLTIKNNQTLLESQINELKENSKNNEYIIKAKLHVKEEQIQELKNNDKIKEDAFPHLSDQLLVLSERIQQLQRINLIILTQISLDKYIKFIQFSPNDLVA